MARDNPGESEEFDASMVPDRTKGQLKEAAVKIINRQIARYEHASGTRALEEEEAAILEKFGRLLQTFEEADRKKKPGEGLDKTVAEMISEILDSVPLEVLEDAKKRRRGQ